MLHQLSPRRLKVDLRLLGFLLFLATYLVLFLIEPRLGPIDDHGFLDTIQIGKRLDFFIEPKFGRFYPLDAQEYNLIAHFLGPLPFYYYLFNACQFLLLVLVAWRVLTRVTRQRLAKIGAICYLALVPGFATAYFRLQVPERGALLFFFLFLLCYLRHRERGRVQDLVGSLLFANVALYYKEPGFIMLGVFALLHLVASWRSSPAAQKLLDGLLLLSSGIFCTLYYWLAYRHVGRHRYGETTYDQGIMLLKNLAFFMLSDPLIAVLLPTLLLYRFYRLAIARQDRFHPLYDAMLVAALCYLLVYVALNLQTYHYLLPAYALALPAALHFLKELWPAVARSRWLAVGFGALAVCLINSAVIGLNMVSVYKYVPLNYNKMLDRLAPLLDAQFQASGGKRTAIFLDGVNPASGNEIYASLGKFLNYSGVSSEKFDLRSELPPDNLVYYGLSPHSPYSVFNSRHTDQIQSGDLLVVSPYTSFSMAPDRLAALAQDYELLYRTASPYNIPDVNLKLFAKSLFLWGLRAGGHKEVYSPYFNYNLHRTPDFYVFKKR
ncbi:glycosyltransferase family 39 protein [bacterium]|nr:glycosyltransferase family 39 protein [bacterium]